MSLALFPGWRPGAQARSRLGRLLDRTQSARPADAPRLQPRRPDQWHATLCFIGNDLGDVVTPALRAAFADVAATIPPHVFAIERIAYWSQSGAIVALPHRSDALQALCDATRDAIRRQGIRPAQATTQPHVTLAYLARHMPSQPWLDQIDCSDTDCAVDGFDLLFNPGGRYQALGEWRLSGAALAQAPRQGTLL